MSRGGNVGFTGGAGATGAAGLGHPTAAGLRHRRADAARALAGSDRRAQVGWGDLAAWPDWAALDAGALDALQLRAGAWRHAEAWARCIDGALLQRLQALVGSAAASRLLAQRADGTAAGADTTAGPALPAVEALADWLRAGGLELLLAALPSPLLRLLWRERLAPLTTPPMPALDGVWARQRLGWARQ